MTFIKKTIKKIIYFILMIIGKIRNIFSLSGDGERVDIKYEDGIVTDNFDIYQKSHFYRYKYALENIKEGDIVADLACGTGYGAVMLSKKAENVIGVDINPRIIKKIKKIYKKIQKVSFFSSDLLKISYEQKFDVIVSFETIEHFEESNIPNLFLIYYKAIKSGGKLIFSTPFMQENTENARKMGFHLTFNINEDKINSWLSGADFKLCSYKYQNYKTHEIVDTLNEKDFIICIAEKKQ